MATDTGHLSVARRGWRWLMAMGIGVPLIAGLAIILLAVITYVSPNYHATRQTDVGQPVNFAIDAPVYFETQRFWVVKIAEGQIIALYDRDPISGCTVPWNKDLQVLGTKGWFRDACSDSTYDLSGSCFFGPCQIGLNRLAVSTAASGDIVVDMTDGGRGALRDDAAKPVIRPQ
jgi:Rieske Fe-S protein